MKRRLGTRCRIRPLDAGWLTSIAVLCLLGRPVVADDSGKMVLDFEPRSTRLASTDVRALDRFVAMLESQPDYHLVICVPSPRDTAIRRFVASRLAVVQRELLKRSVAGETVAVPQSEGEVDSIVLRIAPRVLTNTPLEILSPTRASLAASDISSQVKNDISLVPLVLLPEGSGGQDVTPAMTTDVTSISLPELPSPQSDLLKTDKGGTRPAENSDVAVEDVWTAAVGQSLRTVLKEWGTRAGWTIIWQSDREYPVDATATFSGNFTQVAGQLFDGFATAVPAPAAHFYKGNHVLLVESGEGR